MIFTGREEWIRTVRLSFRSRANQIIQWKCLRRMQGFLWLYAFERKTWRSFRSRLQMLIQIKTGSENVWMIIIGIMNDHSKTYKNNMYVHSQWLISLYQTAEEHLGKGMQFRNQPSRLQFLEEQKHKKFALCVYMLTTSKLQSRNN